LKNEFESEHAMKGKDWRFKNFDVKDFVCTTPKDESTAYTTQS